MTCGTEQGNSTLALFLESEFTLLVVIFVLSTTPVFTTLKERSATFYLTAQRLGTLSEGGARAETESHAGSHLSLILGHTERVIKFQVWSRICDK